MVPRPVVTGATFITPKEARSGQGDLGGILRFLVLAMEVSRAVLSMLSPIHSPVFKEHIVLLDSPVAKMRKVVCLQLLHVGS